MSLKSFEYEFLAASFTILSIIAPETFEEFNEIFFIISSFISSL
jgi:hypothetical protein